MKVFIFFPTDSTTSKTMYIHNICESKKLKILSRNLNPTYFSVRIKDSDTQFVRIGKNSSQFKCGLSRASSSYRNAKIVTLASRTQCEVCRAVRCGRENWIVRHARGKSAGNWSHSIFSWRFRHTGICGIWVFDPHSL